MVASLDAEYDGCTNDDGISVSDVTDPGRPRYAMMQLTGFQLNMDDSSEESEPIFAEDHTIMNASDYMQCYPGDYAGTEKAPVERDLDILPLLDGDAPRSAWQKGLFYPRASEGGAEAGADHDDDPAMAALGPGASKLDYLMTLSYVKSGIEDDISLYEDEVPIPACDESVRAMIYANPQIVQE